MSIMHTRTSVVLAAVIVAAVSGPALAQQGPAQASTRVFLGIDAGYQVTSTTFQTTATYPLNVEQATVSATYDVGPGVVVGARGGVRLWKHLAIGAGVANFTWNGTADVSATLPHPFYLNRHRQASATLDAFERRETMVSVEASWLIQAGPKLDIMVFGGPAFFRGTLTTAGEAEYSESYPYDEAALSDVDRERHTLSATGFSIGADVAYLFTKTIGVGGLLRVSRASGRPGSADTGSTVDLGGVQASGGLRIRF